MNERRPQSTLEIKNKNNILRKKRRMAKEKNETILLRKMRWNVIRKNKQEGFSFETLSLGKQLARNTLGKRIASSGAHRWSMAYGRICTSKNRS